MRLLVLGGTAWLGQWLATVAVERGHSVTCLARGASGPVPEGATLVRADRELPAAYDGVSRAEWDVVLDVSRQPGQVRRAATALAARAGRFVFVSTGNVYADHSAPGQDETAPTLPALEGDVMQTMESYGPAKAACEQAVLAAFGPDRVLVARAGLLGGPGDVSDRTGYWPRRFARPASADGRVLVPEAPAQSSQVLDVRDLAVWLVEAGDRGAVGVFNATGETMTLARHLEVARAVAGHSAPVVPAGSDWLLARDVQPWMGPRSLPLWLPDPAWAGFPARSSARAAAAGLVRRPLEETLADTLAWELSRPPAARKAGLSDDDERSLLAALGHV